MFKMEIIWWNIAAGLNMFVSIRWYYNILVGIEFMVDVWSMAIVNGLNVLPLLFNIV